MRQGQQHRRGRGRNNNGGGGHHNTNNNNRRGQNPLSRSFESNGPDVKVRGTPADIATKYLALARDAQTSGDPVLAENYFQHAEHYNRIIMAYREQQVQQQGHEGGANGNQPRFRHDPLPGQEPDEAGDDEGGDETGAGDQPSVQARGGGEQPRLEPGQRPDDGRTFEPRQHEGRHQEGRQHEGRPYEGRQQQEGRQADNREGRNYEGGRHEGRHDRPRHDNQRHDNQQRFRDRDRDRDRDQRFRQEGRHDRGDRFERDRGERFDRDRGERFDRGDRDRDRGERGDRPFERPAPQQPDSGFAAERRAERTDEPRAERSQDRPAQDRAPAGFERPAVEDRVPQERPLEVSRPVEAVPVATPRGDDAVAGDPPVKAPRRRAAAVGIGSDQPEFLRRPVRRPRREAEATTEPVPPSGDDGQGPQT